MEEWRAKRDIKLDQISNEIISSMYKLEHLPHHINFIYCLNELNTHTGQNGQARHKIMQMFNRAKTLEGCVTKHINDAK